MSNTMSTITSKIADVLNFGKGDRAEAGERYSRELRHSNLGRQLRREQVDADIRNTLHSHLR